MTASGVPASPEAPVPVPLPEDGAESESAGRTWFALRTMREERFFLLLAVFIGVFSGLAVVCFRLAIDWTKIWLLGPVPEPHNWRLIAAPPQVVDYVVVHELCHLEHPNHSARFWQRVEQAFPQHAMARAWLKKHHYETDFLLSESELHPSANAERSPV